MKHSLIGALILSALFSSCSSKEEAESLVRIRLTDSPAPYEEVNIEITGVRIQTDADGWISIPVDGGIYNLLAYSNDTLKLGSIVFKSSNIRSVQLQLGGQNTVKTGGSIHALSLSDNDAEKLTVNSSAEVVGGLPYDVIFDFDAEASVIENSNGTYRLKPSLKVTVR